MLYTACVVIYQTKGFFSDRESASLSALTCDGYFSYAALQCTTVTNLKL